MGNEVRVERGNSLSGQLKKIPGIGNIFSAFQHIATLAKDPFMIGERLLLLDHFTNDPPKKVKQLKKIYLTDAVELKKELDTELGTGPIRWIATALFSQSISDK